MTEKKHFENVDEAIFDISSKAFIDETEHVNFLLSHTEEFQKKEKQIAKHARELIEKMPKQAVLTDIQSFLHEYSLNTKEGIAIMCIAEALLRIPDAKTADRLIRDKLGSREWKSHFGTSSMFVNASTWGLMLTGKLADLGKMAREDETAIFSNIVSKLGEPVTRTVMKKAMSVIGRQFVMGENMDEAKKNAEIFKKRGYTISYDMLGEGARSKKQSDKYFDSYIASIEALKDSVDKEKPLYGRASISVKLSSLHPRYELLKLDRLREELVPKIKTIMKKAKEVGITVSIDAEESSRLDVSLIIFEELVRERELMDFDGVGFVLQSYHKRSFYIIDYLLSLAKKYKKKIPIRLVKGAYWDTEIKLAQIKGLESYPVFTRKEHTDISYLACAGKILQHSENFYPQFATHNALTIASIMEIAGDKEYEFQRLRGMGGALYSNVVDKVPCRVYAPVGKQEELLPYLIRRLLENGANTSFVNLLADGNTPIEELLNDPIERTKTNDAAPSFKTPIPRELYGKDRLNSYGIDLGNLNQMNDIISAIKKYEKIRWQATPIINGNSEEGGKQTRIYRPSHNDEVVGTVNESTDEAIDAALESAKESSKPWNEKPADERAEILDRLADLFEENRDELMALCIYEAGKTIPDAIGEVREAADFCRYYAARAKELFSKGKELRGPIGEVNIYSLHGRGTFLCISPWNFPLAIFTGQVVAALATGNAVIAKPSEQTPLIATLAIRLMHEAGIPKNILHLLTGDGEIGAKIVSDLRISGVAFTGSTETARKINKSLAERSGAIIPLIAETGGQNCMVADSSILLEQTVDDIIISAFGSAGQRCSALRVLYLQEEIADGVLELLSSAMSEYKIGYPENIFTDIGPVIDRNAQKPLLSHIKEMTSISETIYAAEIDDKIWKNGTFVPPHIFEIKSISQLKEENFGPILHVIRFKMSELEKIVEEINSTEYGLTLGIQSRIGKTSKTIICDSHVGNCYVNRSMTGAVVGVQPFGGENLSGTGPKAGGPYYLLRFASEKTVTVNTAAIGGSIEILT